ncbi:MAG: hypothetical protein L3K13_02515 [Thermoplasmata archaeon]|nr:hypothetical protein [Thermoplasmata archaeon]
MSKERSRRTLPPVVSARRKKDKYPTPREFRPVRDTPAGRFPLLTVFRGLERTVPFRKYPGDDAAILRIARRTWAHLVDGPGWMYVAPPTTPPEVRAAGFRMVESTDDEIVVARAHLVNSPSMDVYLDVIHEFLHILQRRQGRALWLGPKVPYVDRPTEIEAYAFSVAEARRLGVPDSYLREYLRVTWVTKTESLRLLRNVGVSAKN